MPGLYEAFFADQDKFEELYVQYEQDPSIRKRAVKAVGIVLFINAKNGRPPAYLHSQRGSLQHSLTV